AAVERALAADADERSVRAVQVGEEVAALATRDARVGAGDVAILGEEDVAALAADHHRVAEEREGGAVLAPAEDHREAAPVAGVRRAHHLGAVVEGLRRADHVEAEELLAHAEDLAVADLLLAAHLHEHAVQAAGVAHEEAA